MRAQHPPQPCHRSHPELSARQGAQEHTSTFKDLIIDSTNGARNKTHLLGLELSPPYKKMYIWVCMGIYGYIRVYMWLYMTIYPQTIVFGMSGLVLWMSGLVLWMSGLVLWMSGLVFWMSGLVFGCLDLYSAYCIPVGCLCTCRMWLWRVRSHPPWSMCLPQALFFLKKNKPLDFGACMVWKC